MTLNLAGLHKDWFERRYDAAVEGLAPYRLDLLAMQETAVRVQGETYDQARHLAESLGLRYVAFAPYGNPVEVMSPEQGGVAIASRFPILRSRPRRLPSRGEDEPDARVALLTTFETPAGELHAVTTHLSWQPSDTELRLLQMGFVLEAFARGEWSGIPPRGIVLGDINALEDEPCVQLASERLCDVYRATHPDEPGPTWSRSNPWAGAFDMPDRRLDYVFCPRGVVVHDAAVALVERAASDHYGVYADLEWPEGPG